MASRVGLLLAAGRSRRMGCPKLALPWPPVERCGEARLPALDGGRPSAPPATPAASALAPPQEARPRTVIGHVHDVLAGWCSDMVVVLGGDADVVRQALGGRRRAEVPGDADAPMFDSIRRGLLAARSLRPDLQQVLLTPADQVGVDAADIGALLRAAAEDRTRAHLPQAGGRGGHPVVVPAALIPAILQWPGTDGLAGLWRACPELVRRHTGASARSRLDIDTPEEYRRTWSDRREVP